MCPSAIKNKSKKPQKKLRVFIGSSKEGLNIARYIKRGLGRSVDSTIWNEAFFGLSESALETLEREARRFDCAVLVFTPDDLRVMRGRKRKVPRDNIILEFGLFTGALGRNRTFIVYPRDKQLEMPSDTFGITAATYFADQKGNMRKAIEPVCSMIRRQISRIAKKRFDFPSKAEESTKKRKRIARRRRRRSLGVACTTEPKDCYHIINISSSGALLETDGKMTIGKLIDLDLDLEDETSARVKARVVRNQYPNWKKKIAGSVGVEFVECEGKAKNIIHKYVESDPKAYD